MHAVHPRPTCKLPVAVATVTEPGDELAIELEDEDAAGLVVHHDDVAVPVYGDAFGAHQLPRADLILAKEQQSRQGVMSRDHETCTLTHTHTHNRQIHASADNIDKMSPRKNETLHKIPKQHNKNPNKEKR